MQPGNVKVLAFNIEYGAQGYALSRAVDLVRDADVAIIAESRTMAGINSAELIAKKLKWHHMEFPANGSAVLSRWAFGPRGATWVGINTPKGVLFVVPVHLSDFPYQPFQAEKIQYCYDKCQRNLSDPSLLIEAAKEARQPGVSQIIETVRYLGSKGPIVVAGDFNEPSHLDWTPRAAAAKLCPMAVNFPTSRQLQAVGLVDMFRDIYPDEVAAPGHTWPSPHRPDRIDFIYAKNLSPLSCRTLATPSDHKAVVAELMWKNNNAILFAIIVVAVIVIIIIAAIVKKCLIRVNTPFYSSTPSRNCISENPAYPSNEQGTLRQYFST